MRHRAVMLLAALTVLLYAGAIRGPFVYEDANWLAGIGQPVVWSQPVPNRLLTTWTYQATARYLGLWPSNYHAGNLALHLLTGLALYAFVRLLAGTSSALIALAVFWLHPLLTEAVQYPVGRSDLLLTLCAVLATWLSCRRSWWALVPLAVSAWTKEMAIVVPALVGWTLYQLQQRRARLAPWVAFGAVCGFAGVRLWHAEEIGGGGWWPALALQCAALVRYLMLCVWPVGLSIDHDFYAVSHAWQFAAVLLVGSSLWVAWRVRSTRPWVTWAIGWVLIAVAPRMLLGTPEVLAERQWYLPMVGICAAFGACWEDDDGVSATRAPSRRPA